MNEKKIELADLQMSLEGIAAQVEMLNQQAQPLVQRKGELMKQIIEQTRAEDAKKIVEKPVDKKE